MSLITENTRKNADKCLDCAMMRMRALEDNASFKEIGASLDIKSASVMKVVEQAVNISCNTCPNAEDFKKIYGMMPYDYLKRGRA